MDIQASPGEIVEIKTSKETIAGTLLESHEPGLILLKLKSGYNVGILKEDVLSTKVTKLAEKKQPLSPLQKKDLPEIDMIMTGGTISSRLDPKTGAAYNLLNPQELLSSLLSVCRNLD